MIELRNRIYVAIRDFVPDQMVRERALVFGFPVEDLTPDLHNTIVWRAHEVIQRRPVL